MELLNSSERISPMEYKEIITNQTSHILIDVREPQELDICSLPAVSRNVPYSKMNSEKVMDGLNQYFLEKTNGVNSSEKLPGYFFLNFNQED